ncbi:long-chain fatty acid--CoA ligase [Yinghuangia sp. ASG 101]|uniref:AMP-dependent synthetase/ligase n=1 Tax=Yinghuangia sp. ASG 101 TaxID=2896848 RepID=UPI001E5C927E|nr:long-chain fatty acid--CoA ligase [Yinghuangia sp. ASG 101]UGQ09830.1 long-chain fatty acid--CoA ligase [Yinghuangia sp. ASG 101]
MSDTGTETATAIENRSESFAVDFLERVRATPDTEAYRFPSLLPDGREEWASLTWAQAAERVKAIAAGLHALGVRPTDRVAIVAQTRVEWILADFGTACAGAATTTVYPTTNADEAAFILADSGSTIVFAEDDRQIAKLRGAREHLGAVRKIVTFDGTADDDWVVTLATLEADGRAVLAEDPGLVERLVGGITRDRLATLVYTSGTTGRPKGVRLTHDTWAYQAVAQQQMGLSDATDLQYLWLPLAHCYGKVMTVGQLRVGYTTAVDGRHTELIRNLPIVKPTFMAAAPRVFEKVYNAIHARVRRESPLRQRLFAWGVGVGRRYADATRGGRTASPALTLRHRLADRLVLAKLREPFGGRMRGCISGSAALSDEVAGFFEAIGVPVLQGYGLTEASAGSTVNRYRANHLGTVGLPLPGTEIRIAEDDGEVLVRGPAVMSGYHNDAEATAAVLDADGWLHTGDIGEIDTHGALRITDRKKDLIKTSNGKYVAPSDIEGRFKGLCPFVGNIVVHGDNRTYCTALITLDADALHAWAAGAGGGLAALPYAELVATPQVKALIDGYVAKLNTGLQRWQTIKRFAILPRDLSVENGELTPSLKVKRAVVEREYADVLAALYDDGAAR